ncbi:MAG: hypothetical protein WA832_05980 [Bradyrhizobium sp.]|uniref:hypothetical protein n=1 Tax=Bradyrhizobium sp. TaxID=376 RepID=UPI003C7AF5C3
MRTSESELKVAISQESALPYADRANAHGLNNENDAAMADATRSIELDPGTQPLVDPPGVLEVEQCPIEAVPIDAIAIVKWLQQFLPQESNNSRMAYGLAIAGHAIIALLLLLGFFERIEPTEIAAIPVEIVMEKPAAAASSPSDSASNEQNRLSGIPAVADVDKRAKAPLATLDVNGIDLPKQPGHDGGDPSSDPAGAPVPPADGDLASGAASLPSWAIEPTGLAQRQTTAREPGEDELTAVKEQKLECGRKAKRPSPAVAIRNQARVLGFVTEGQALAMTRSSQLVADRHINPHYLRSQEVFAETLDGTGKFAVAVPSGLSVNVGDVIEFDQGHIDPADPCRYIPNLAVSNR